MREQTKTDVDSTINILDFVMTTKEASEKYDVADCTFRTWIKEGLFQTNEIKKSGNTWLIKREAIEEVLKKKNKFGKTFVVDGEELHAEHMGYKGKTIQVWYKNNEVKSILGNMPQKDLVHQMLEVFKKDTKMNYKMVVIDSNTENSDNWFFRKEKVWVITLKGVVETVRQSMILKDVDTNEFDSYLKKVNISI